VVVTLLVNQGFSGKIYCSNPTMIAKLILMDSAKIQEEEGKSK
jgi:metallo-beta-lactamase family protein